jgi:hypothetical protein
MTQDEIINIAIQAGFWNGLGVDGLDELNHFAKLVEEKERKACAELCMDLHTLTDGAHNFYHFAANQILKRGQA